MKSQNENSTLIIRDSRPELERVFNALDVSEETRKDYKLRLPKFLNHLEKHGMGFNSFIDFKRSLEKQNNLSVASKNKYLIVAKIFLKEAFRLNLLPSDITSGVKLFKESRKHKKNGLNEAEIERLSNYLSRLPDTQNNLRIKAILSLLIFQGLRQIELVRLDVTDFDLENKSAMIQGKGQHEKEIVDLHPNTVSVLKKYVKANNLKDGPIFFSKSNYMKNQRLTTRSIRNIVKSVFRELNINRVVHGTRHYFVSKLLRSYGGDLTMVMNYTRHKSIATIQVYNDNLKQKEDLPRFYRAFNNVVFS